MVRQEPSTAWLAPVWLLSGWPRLKDEIVARTRLPVRHLPWRPEVLDYLRKEREAGRTLLLVTASAQRIADEVAAQTGLFDEVIGSASGEGLLGVHKAQRLVERFGPRGFDYMGDARADLAVWAQARKALVVGNGRLVRKARAVAEVEAVFTAPRARRSAWLEAIGVLPWLCLLLVLIPGWEATMAALVFFLGSIAFALLDGVMSISSDRADPERRRRPFASGRLPVLPAVCLCGWLLPGVALAALKLPGIWGVAFGAYAALRLTLPFRPRPYPLLYWLRNIKKTAPSMHNPAQR